MGLFEEYLSRKSQSRTQVDTTDVFGKENKPPQIGAGAATKPTNAPPISMIDQAAVTRLDSEGRPPRLSKRERDYYCFHLDLSAEHGYLLPSLTRYIVSYGAKYSAFLDVNVTHIISDKPRNVMEASVLINKFDVKILYLPDFLQKIVESYDRLDALSKAGLGGNQVKRPPLSATIRKAAALLNTAPNLSHLLAEERLNVYNNVANRPSRVTLNPLYNAQQKRGDVTPTGVLPNIKTVIPSPADGATAANEPRLLCVVGDKKVTYIPFDSPFMLLEEVNRTYAQVCKEYKPTAPGKVAYPMIFFESGPHQCPWVQPKSHKPENLKEYPRIPPAAPKTRPLLVAHEKKHAKTLSHYKSIFFQNYLNRPKPLAHGLGQAPVPPIVTNSSHLKNAPERPRPGFCECCYERYSNLEKHVRKDGHRKLACNTEFYRVVDRVINSVVRKSACNPPVSPTPSEKSYPIIDHHDHDDLPHKRPSHGDGLPLSPVKSQPKASALDFMPVPRHRSIPLKNITNNHTAALLKEASQTAKTVPLQSIENTIKIDQEATTVIEAIGSDSPLYSSPSFKRRRSQRLLGKSTSVTNMMGTVPIPSTTKLS